MQPNAPPNQPAVRDIATTPQPKTHSAMRYAAAGRAQAIHHIEYEAVAAMQAMLDARPKDKLGKHEYRLEDYGLTRGRCWSGLRGILLGMGL